ncbi:hydantoinase B/oxoprolinase family protein [Acidihalobacter prosperus]|uniref:5-oxoprolinase n=1 Tax=Acidihalobacter prosperus TaxID=160660 RepID=A0A1A6C3W2_9GAMM|nr:hydantoinase B/oxoprolinase family protein [Acidihalobacter prosperus]OBS09248.1 5-oxoprolinase [Acidihalobacter prosperus]
MNLQNRQRWRFWIDRGGTFTDVVAVDDAGALRRMKLLSEDPEHYADAAVEAVRRLLGVASGAPLPVERIAEVRMGTTVATNALLERKGARVLLVTARGLGDALWIGYQNRPELFALHIRRPAPYYAEVLEVDGRVDPQGREIEAIDTAAAGAGLAAARTRGCEACAIVLPHAFAHPRHEQALVALAETAGFTEISASHAVAPQLGFVARGQTTVIDGYLTPPLRRYVRQVAEGLSGAPLYFMKSDGGLCAAEQLRGADAILSGPAGGVVGAISAAAEAGFERLIGLDMGGTSTDVCHYAGELERAAHSEVAGQRLLRPTLAVHTVAAGGGSIVDLTQGRLTVGPASAGADPGPACYRRGGPLTLTDCNLFLGRLVPERFPRVFGPTADQPLDPGAAAARLRALADILPEANAETIAAGALAIGVAHMAEAIRKITLGRGLDIEEHCLIGFGGAGGQHACQVAAALGLRRVLLPPLGGVLSAYGIGMAAVSTLRRLGLERSLDATAATLSNQFERLIETARPDLAGATDPGHAPEIARRVQLRYRGADTTLALDWMDGCDLATAFHARHAEAFGFVQDAPIVVAAIEVELSLPGHAAVRLSPAACRPAEPLAHQRAWFDGWITVPVYARADLPEGQMVNGPAIVAEDIGTTVVEPGWRLRVQRNGALLLEADAEGARTPVPATVGSDTTPDPVRLELFRNRFMAIAEQMGEVLRQTAHSVNIKERLDYSCAIFAPDGGLVANAPHIPVHLGSMSETIRGLLDRQTLRPGQVWVQNNPYAGGTHLPDVTAITPVFDAEGRGLQFLVASRAHHADIGGITPGSMPPGSRRIEEEGVLIDDFLLVEAERLRVDPLRELLAGGPYPARNPEQNLADLKAQIAANHRGRRELLRTVAELGLPTVQAYMGHIQANAEAAVRALLERLPEGRFETAMDNGARIAVAVRIERAQGGATIDFSGTSPQRADNFNAPTAVTRAAVLYWLRTLVGEDIPLNDGCLKPVRLIVPPGSLLAPVTPAAVVAGNVEISQVVAECLFAAVGACASAQGTMNNLSFGSEVFQHYETLGGGSGAGPDFDGMAAVHAHMSNSRLTDPEVMEWRFPIRVEAFTLRPGSGGAGRHRGGDGLIRRLRLLEPMTVALLSNRRTSAPFGLAGGDCGQPGSNRLIRADGRVEDLGACGQREAGAGDLLIVETPGGGGFGAA